MEQKAGTSAVISIIVAIASYFLTFSAHPLYGLLAALVAIPLGIIGLFMAASPRIGGGLLSTAAIILAVGAIGVAVLGLIGVIIF